MHAHTISYYCYFHQYFTVWINRWVDSINNCCWYWRKCSCLLQLKKNWLWYEWLNNFNGLTFLLQDSHIVIFIFKFIIFLLQFYLEFTLFLVELSFIKIMVSQIVMFYWYNRFKSYMLITTMHAHTIVYYCYFRHFFLFVHCRS